MDRYAGRQWNEDWAVVTAVENAKASTIITALGRSASIKLEAESDQVARITLSDASIKLGVASEQNVESKFVTESGLQPLIGLSKVQAKSPAGPWRRGRRFEPLESIHMPLDTIRASTREEGADLNDVLFFGDVRDG
jgi:hypothetical protein